MLIVGIETTALTAAERDWLQAPQVSGVILFTRNFTDPLQLQTLVGELRALRGAEFLICVDQEGGPVQRFRGHGLTRLPALARIGELYERDPQAALTLASEHAWLMASEMRAFDIDLSFAPVLDLARGNRAIGPRALHAAPGAVAELGCAYLGGMRQAGMAATLKHFPGHGSVREDTHIEDARDPRSLDELRGADLEPFRAAFDAGAAAVMMAHVSYPQIDAEPAGYSGRWIGDILRREYGFAGAVFSDDIAMAAAAPAGAAAERIARHLEAGCDLVLVCKPGWGARAVDECRDLPACPADTLRPLLGGASLPWPELLAHPRHVGISAQLSALVAAGG